MSATLQKRADFFITQSDVGYAVPEDKDFDAYLLENFSKNNSSDDQGPESGDEDEVGSDDGELEVAKKPRE